MSSTSATEASQIGGLARARRSRWRLAGGSRGLLAASALVAVVVLAPVVITIWQALQGGTSAALKSIDASSPRTLLLHSVLVAAVASPLAGVIGVTLGVVHRAHERAPAVAVDAAGGGAVDDAAVRDQLCVGFDRHAHAGLPRGRGHHRLLLLPDRVPARGGRAAGHGPGARGGGSLAGPEHAADVLPRDPAAAAPGAAGGHAARRAGHAGGVRRVRGAQVPDVHRAHLRPVRAQLQRLGRGGAVALLDRAVRACCCSGSRGCGVAPTTRA